MSWLAKQRKKIVGRQFESGDVYIKSLDVLLHTKKFAPHEATS